ncbi:hypothetical protein R2F25_18330 [Streptomyces sp. UP1A-1]|nr:hypothetical protein [Streptomyces sp. UP1A-1]
MTCGPLSLTDPHADWLPGGHRGKTLTAGTGDTEVTAVVTDNTATRLTLAPRRPGARTAWPHDAVPAPGTAYRLPDAPTPRTGLTAAAAVTHPYVHGNRIRDDGHPRTQTHALWLAHEATWTALAGSPATTSAATPRRPPASTRHRAADAGGTTTADAARRLRAPAARPPRSAPPCRSPRPPPGAWPPGWRSG